MDKLIEMQQIFMKMVRPQLAQHCTLGGFFEGNLTIYAHNGAIAAKLRQTLPSLLLKFQTRGYEVTAIRIAVQANYHAIGGNDLPGNLSRKSLKIGQAGRESLNGLAAELPPSPLRSAVESLLKRQIK
ncbi:MAG: DciA family protein [Nitrosospira sp.]